MILGPLQRRFDLSNAAAAACGAAALAYGMTMGILHSPVAGVASAGLLFCMALVMLIDLRYFIIPDLLSLPSIPAGILVSLLVIPGEWQAVVLDRCLAAGLAAAALYGLRWLFYRIRGVIGLGLGDVKLAAAAGAWLGTGLLHWTLLLASLSALIATLLRPRIAAAEKARSTTKVPFGAFIAPAMVVMWTILLLGT